MSLDVLFIDGDLPPLQTRLVTGRELIAQKIFARLNTLVGDWPLEVTAGLPWIEFMSNKLFDLDTMVALILVEINDVAGVAAVENLVREKTGRTFTMTATIITSEAEEIPTTLTFDAARKNASIYVGGVAGHSGTIAP